MISCTLYPGRRSQTRFALGYYLSGFQPFNLSSIQPLRVEFPELSGQVFSVCRHSLLQIFYRSLTNSMRTRPHQGRAGFACSAAFLWSRSQRVFENSKLGSIPTCREPVPSPDASGPDGMGRASPTNDHGLLLSAATLVPVGGSPTGTGGSPVLPIFQTRAQA